MQKIKSTQVKYFAEAPYHNYDKDTVLEFMDFVKESDIQCCPSTRYYSIQENGIHFWQRHFLFGFANLSEAEKFTNYTKTAIMPGKVIDGRFVIENESSGR